MSNKMLTLIILALLSPITITESSNTLKSEVYLSPAINMQSGKARVVNFYNISFPKGHIALKSFDAELVDDEGNSVPLYNTYVHHWILVRYYVETGVVPNDTNALIVSNSGVCSETLSQYYGFGAESRRTSTWVPDPYGIHVGNPNDIPYGYEEQWYLSMLALDTRGVQDRMGCTQCRCDLYNVTKDPSGNPLPKGYKGGLRCCYDGTQCLMEKGVERTNRTVFLRYTVKWQDWVDSIKPVSIYVFDVAACKVEYDIFACNNQTGNCVQKNQTSFALPTGGDLVYGSSHMHAGALNITVYGQDGRNLCTSTPTYGTGTQVGNEDGYIVGMSSCYPKPGSVKVADGEMLTVEGVYKSEKENTGVMSLFYFMVAQSESI